MVKTLLFIVPNLDFIIIYPPKPAGSGPGQAGAGGFFFANKRFFLANKRFFLANKRYLLDRFEPNREPLVRFSGSSVLEI